MPRMFTAPLACVLLFSFLAIGIGAGRVTPAQADITYQLIATPTDIGRGAGLGGFSLQYFGQNGDSLFHVAELVPGSFSGLSVVGYPVFDILDGAAGTQADSPFTDEDPVYRSWTFHSTTLWSLSAAGDDWKYERNIVPIPPTALLLGAGLIPLAWARRKKRLGP